MASTQPLPLDFWKWLDADASSLAQAGAAPDAGRIVRACRAIADACGAGPQAPQTMFSIMHTLSDPGILKLFIKGPDGFVDIAKAAGRHSDAAFRALSSGPISALMAGKPGSVTRLISSIISDIGRGGMPEGVNAALLLLSNDDIAGLAVNRQAVFFKNIRRIAEISQRFSPHVFSALADSRLAGAFSKKPDAVVSSLESVSKIAGPEAAAIFLLQLRKPKPFALFEKGQSRLVGPLSSMARKCGGSAPGLFFLLNQPKISYLFETDPAGVIGSLGRFIKGAGKGAHHALPFLFKDAFEESFIKDPAACGKAFGSLYMAAPKSSQPVFRAVYSSEALCGLLLADSPKLAKAISAIGKATGKSSQAAFMLLSKPPMTAVFERNPGAVIAGFRQIADAAGPGAQEAFAFLGRDKPALLLSENPAKMIGFIAKIGRSSQNSRRAFAFLSNQRFAEGFDAWPDTAMENIAKIADSAGPYAGNLFALLSKDRFSQAIAELVSGEHLATCLINLVNGSGKETPGVLRLFDNDEFAKRFINDPYREEQIVDHLRSFAGKDLAKGLEVINDPDIAPVFAADPSVLVTTRFRAYVDNATSKGASASDAIEAILKDRKVKRVFIEYCRGEFSGNDDPQMMEKGLMPAFDAYMRKKQKA